MDELKKSLKNTVAAATGILFLILVFAIIGAVTIGPWIIKLLIAKWILF